MLRIAEDFVGIVTKTNGKRPNLRKKCQVAKMIAEELLSGNIVTQL